MLTILVGETGAEKLLLSLIYTGGFSHSFIDPFESAERTQSVALLLNTL